MAGDVPPVLAGGQSHALKGVVDRPMGKTRKKKRSEAEAKDSRRVRNSLVAGLLGVQEGGIFPGDAKVVGSSDASNNALALDDFTEPDQGVSDPYKGDVEPLIDPSVALVAPDVTPNALKPMDPSSIPGADKGAPPEREMPTPQPTPQPISTAPPAAPAAQAPPTDSALGSSNNAVNTMDMLLGRKRGTQESASSGSAAHPANVTPISEAAAMSSLPGITPISDSISAVNAMSVGTGMPEPKRGDGSQIMAAHRRFKGAG